MVYEVHVIIDGEEKVYGPYLTIEEAHRVVEWVVKRQDPTKGLVSYPVVVPKPTEVVSVRGGE